MAVGKSFGAKEYVIKQFLKKHSQFIYMRRYDNEIKSIFDSNRDYFDDIANFFPKKNLKSKDRKFYIDDECFGFAKRMTESQDLKSSTYENVKTLIIDEYPIEKNKRYYLPSEGMILMNIFDSIFRNRNDFKVFILGNSVDDIEYCPLFSFFNLSLPHNKKGISLFKNNLILVNFINNPEFAKDRESTIIGQLAKGTLYEDYAIKNKILNKNNNFIAKKSGSSKFSFAFVFNSKIYGVWNDFKNSKVFVSYDYIDNTPFLLSMSIKDHVPNTMMFNALKKYNFWKHFLDNFKLGNVYYENQSIKHVVYEIIRIFGNFK